MIFIYRYFSGYLKLDIIGEFPERILNLCADSSITLWGTKSDGGGLTAYITIKDFYSLRDIIKGTNIRVHIKEKYGFPFVFSKYRYRFGIFAGLIFFIMFLNIMSGFIWIIDINGNKDVKSEEIVNALEEIGIHEGIKSSKISPKSDSQKLLLKLDSLAWASLNIEGSRLTVNVTEATEKGNKDNRPCNLKAEFDGIIKKIDLKSGKNVVKVGDTVKKGDVLVSGIIENAGGTRFVRCEGEVIAEVTRTIELEMPCEIKKDIETGEKKKRNVLELFTLKIPLYLGDETKSCNKSLNVNQLKLFGKALPIRIYSKEYRYTEKVTYKYTEAEMKEELKNKASTMLKNEKITDYTVKNSVFTKKNDGMRLELTVIYLKNIAYEDFLLISTGN